MPGSFRETERLLVGLEGDGGGGIETALGRRARGVPGPGLGRVGVPEGAPTPILCTRPALGVKGELIARGDVRFVLDRVGDDKPNDSGGLVGFLLGLEAPAPRLPSCFAVIPM